MPDFADDPRSELERKAAQLRVVALCESIGYIALFVFWVVVPNDIARVFIGFVHGWLTIALAVMVVMIYPRIEWAWWWIPLSLLPIVGGFLLYEKLRRGAPKRVTPTWLDWDRIRASVLSSRNRRTSP